MVAVTRVEVSMKDRWPSVAIVGIFFVVCAIVIGVANAKPDNPAPGAPSVGCAAASGTSCGATNTDNLSIFTASFDID